MLIKRCLERDPKRRLRDIGDARFDMEVAPAGTPAAVQTRGRLVPAIVIGAVTLALGLAAGWMVPRGGSRTPEPVRRFGLSGISPVMDAWQAVAVSPDGRSVAYRGFDADGVDRLFVRALDAMAPQPIAGSEGGRLPFFSPDSSEIAYFSTGHLRRSTLGTGSPQTVAPLTGIPLGGTWLDDGSIVFVDSIRGILRVARGATAAETLRRTDHGGDVVTPWALPGGRGILLGVRAGTASRVGLFSPTDGSMRILAENGWSPAWSPTTGLLFTQGTSIVRVPFDIDTLAPTGPAEPIVGDLRGRYAMQSRLFGVADDGTVAYVPAESAGPGVWSLVWVDRHGRETAIAGVDGILDTPRLSPDGTRIVFRKPAPNCDLWVYDIARAVTTRLTLEGDNHGSVWTPDSQHVLFTRVGDPPVLLSVAASGGAAQPVDNKSRLSSLNRRDISLTSWLPRTGELLVRAATDTYLIASATEPKLLGQAAFEDGQAVFSPDGSQIAYASDESGRLEVYVQPHPAGGQRTQVSSDGGSEPVWAPNGKQLFFRQGRKVLAVDVTPSATPPFGRPRLLFSGNYTSHNIACQLRRVVRRLSIRDGQGSRLVGPRPDCCRVGCVREEVSPDPH